MQNSPFHLSETWFGLALAFTGFVFCTGKLKIVFFVAAAVPAASIPFANGNCALHSDIGVRFLLLSFGRSLCECELCSSLQHYTVVAYTDICLASEFNRSLHLVFASSFSSCINALVGRFMEPIAALCLCVYTGCGR